MKFILRKIAVRQALDEEGAGAKGDDLVEVTQSGHIWVESTIANRPQIDKATPTR